MAESIFSKIIKKEIPAEIVYEDDSFIAILDLNPVSPGHTLLIPKEESINLFDTKEEILKKIGPLLKKLGIAVKKAVSADGLNIHMNNGEDAGQMVPHTHLHLIPRFKNDGHKLWHGKPYPEGEMAKIGQKVRESL